MPTNTDPAAVANMARRATTFHGDEAQFWVFDLADGGRVHIPPDQVRRLWNAEQLHQLQQLKECECPARKLPMEIVRYMQERADALAALCGDKPLYELPSIERYYRNAGASTAIHNLANEIGSNFVNRLDSAPCPCECPARKALERLYHANEVPAKDGHYAEVCAVLSAPCPCEDRLAASQERERLLGEQLEFDRTALADVITGIKKAFDSRFWLTEGRGSYEWDDDRYRSEFREAYQEINLAIGPLKKIAADWTGCPRKAEDVAQARIDLKRRAEAAEERERLLREALQPFASAVMQTRDMIAKMEALGRTCDWKLPMRVTEADWERAAAVATPEGTVRP